MKHVEELKSHISCCTTGQKSQASQAVSSRLELAGGSQLVSRQTMHMSEACREDEQSRQLEHYKIKSPVWKFYLLVA